MGKADLHMHTWASNGKENLDENTQDAAEQDFDVIAITDHDKINEDLDEATKKMVL